jgi:hypothetical protein
MTLYKDLQESERISIDMLLYHSLIVTWSQHVRSAHMWLGALAVNDGDAITFTRPQRLATLCLAILSSMASAALFYGVRPDSLEQQVREW